MKFSALISVFCLLGLTLTACGAGSSADATSAVESLLDQELPKIEPPKGPPPKNVVVKDLKVGTGRPVKATDEVAVRYVGVGYRTGKQFAYYPTPFYFQLGVGRVTPGFDRVVTGMRVGGRREAIVPPRLTYPVLGPNEPFVYIVDMLGFESGAEYKERLRTGESPRFP